uniref:Calponin-homology (CH) domain-containing protein n=1 Tax=Gasterosteus aculeatus aculeatus TaxID=481459 RepID=A0AAQ4QZD7_GASAC
MAASVLLGSMDNVGVNFAVGGGSSRSILVGIDHNGTVGPVPWNRALDRALDEASATGSLNLSSRKLKEFPRIAVHHDLTDTTRADLSRNRLSELPLDVCLFVSLESLNLYQNCVRSLPDSLLNLQALTYLNLSRNQLSVLPVVVCSLPLKVLIACNNKLVSLPEEVGQLRQLTELDVSCNEIRTLPCQVGQLEALRDLNIRRNHLVRLPPELADLPLVRLDFSCNKVTTIPVCYRQLTQLQTIVLDNNPLQTPPAQICIKGKVHIFKYLNLEASKTTPDLPDFDRRPLTFSSCADELYPGRSYGALDSGFNSVDSGDKRWSGNEPTEELSELPLRVAEISRDQRHRGGGGGGGPPVLANGKHVESEQIDFIDSCVGEEEEEEEGRSRGVSSRDSVSLSSQFMAYIERRITREGSPVKTNSRTEDGRRHNRCVVYKIIRGGGAAPVGVERMRREAQHAALRYDEERHKSRSQQRDSEVPRPSTPTQGYPHLMSVCLSMCVQNVYPSRRSTHTDDSALFPLQYSIKYAVLCLCRGRTELLCLLQVTMKQKPLLFHPMTSIYSSIASLLPANPSPSYPSLGSVASCRTAGLRPESFLFRLGQKQEKRKGEMQEEASAAPLVGEDAELVEQLRKNIEARLKVSLPSDLGAALTDGVVLCHLANHVRPRSVPSIHVPSPAVPKLTMAKCRRNVENFLEACRRIGVPQTQLCLPLHILEGGGLPQVAGTVGALLDLAPRRHPISTTTTPAAV